MPHERFQKKSEMGLRGDAILEFDWQVGELMKALDRLQLSEKTLVVLCSDNGPVLDDGYKDGAMELLGNHQPSGPYRGGKYSVYEGGTRTPFITRWKGRIKPAVADTMVCTIDLAASFASLVGEKLPENAFLDSENVLGALLGDPDAKGRKTLLQQDNSGGIFGLRSGHWKLVRLKENKANAPKKPVREQLFDLNKDPGEQTDVSAMNQEVATRLHDELEKIIADGRTRPVR